MAPNAPESFENAVLHRPLRLETLVRVRWLALAGQAVTILAVAWGLNYPLPLVPALALVGLSGLFNVGLAYRFGAGHRPTNQLAALQLAFDLLQLTGLLWLTGGLENPFSLLLLAPVSVSATTLPQRETLWLGLLAGALATILAFSHQPLPSDPAMPIELDPVYVAGIYAAIIAGIAFVAAYTSRVAREARQLADALTATELALSRQQQLSALDGLAAAAAHELGTPLSTIALAAKEMRTDAKDGPLAGDVELIIEQSARCREILAKLRKLDQEGEDPFSAAPLTELLDELVRPFDHYAKTIHIEADGDLESEPLIARNVGLMYGLGNLIENAAQFARKSVRLIARWDQSRVGVTLIDDGPGFQPELLARIGEPYLTSRPREQARPERPGGLGLGVFIAKTLLERSGASMRISNSHMEGHARIELDWPRQIIEQPAGARLLTLPKSRSKTAPRVEEGQWQ